MNVSRPYWLGGMRRLIIVSVALAATALMPSLALSDSARFWMRAEAYRTAAAVALARSDIDRNDPSLIARDFTRTTGHIEGWHSVDNYTPCPLTASDLIGPDKVNCSLSPGVGGVKVDARCPWQTCVVISVRTETWADPVARQVILLTLADEAKICAYAQTYGPNKRFDAMAAGCDRPSREKVQIAIEVKPRLNQPCVYNETTRGERHGFQQICTNPDATLVMLD